jgi:cytochrome c-type protein NapC
MCTRCHSTEAPRWSAVDEHGGMIEDIRSGQLKCVECHGGQNVHPRSLTHGGSGGPPTAEASTTTGKKE